MPDTIAVDVSVAREVLQAEAAAVLALVDRLDDRFQRAIQLLLERGGRVLVTGVGKSGIIARKIASTLSSTGTAAHFLHPTDAMHGDLGTIRSDDVVVAISYSGETEELLRLLAVRPAGVPLVAITGRTHSSLGRAATVALDCRVAAEGCPLNLTPIASTAAAMALGDALAATLLVAKDFGPADFASLHPGGTLGRRLAPVSEVMHGGECTPVVRASTPMPLVFDEMSGKGLGMTCVVDDAGVLVGVITDGDLRRQMRRGTDLRTRCAADVMSDSPIVIRRDTRIADAVRLLEQHKITSIVVVDGQLRVDGVVHLHDLWHSRS